MARRNARASAWAQGLEAGTATSVSVQRWVEGRTDVDLDWAAEEVPVSLEYNGLAHAVMLATPADLEDLACGFSLTEGIVTGCHEILDITLTERSEGIVVAIEILAGRMQAVKERRRNMSGRTGCGLCGVESLDHVARSIPAVSAAALACGERLATALAAMDRAQPLRALTGATHAVGWMTADGELALLREDIGRHNALDKLVGAMQRDGTDPTRGAALLSSRASYEMVHKAAAAGIGIVIAMSAPTGLAIRTARALGVTLAGYARSDRHVAYTHAWRLHGSAAVQGAAA